MTTNEMIDRVHAKHKSVSGYSYNPTVIDEIINAGYAAIPDGAVVAAQGTQRAVKRGEVMETIDNGKTIKTTPIVAAAHDAILIEYATRMSRTSIKIGV